MNTSQNQSNFYLTNGQEKDAIELLDSFGLEKACNYLDDEINDSINREQYLKAEIYRQMKVLIVIAHNS